MSKELKYTYCRYMKQDEFIDFCRNNSVKINSDYLERYEKEKLLYPIKRWLFPEGYIITKKQNLISSTQQAYNSAYSSLLELEEEVFKFSSLVLYDKIDHPFDEKDKEWKEYLIKPINNKFINWKDYKIKYFDKNGRNLNAVRVQNYYSYWQIYELDGINDFRTIYHNTLRFNEKESYYYLTCNKEIVEEWSRRNKNFILKIHQFEDCYDFLCEFIQTYERYIYVALKEKNVGDFLTKEENSLLENKIIDKCNKLIEFYNLSIDNIYEFLKALCRNYFIYENEEKTKLQNLIKIDIWYCIQLILYLTGDTWENVSSKIDKHGQICIYYKIYSKTQKNTLEIIFPNEREDIKENAMLHIDVLLKSYNEKVPYKYQLIKKDIDFFIEFIETNELEHFLMFMVDANKDYFKSNYKSEKNITFHLRNLSIFIEETIKTMGLNSISEIKNKYPTKGPGFKFILSPFCCNESWWGIYCESIKTMNNVSISNFSDKIDQVPQAIDKYQKLDDKQKFVLVNLLRATIIRNYYAHNSTQINNFKASYPLLFESLINSIFVIWAVAKEKIVTNR
ncbi:hypothetical protein [Methanosarcina sp.]|uniref:hypothetical protein n=2 Tax=Methanosarcina sp. TaxID=2213 RepID=UPI002988F3FB|nr:hypothetical protein [Methanosarcina sp.]MDW5552020.1 hypothetical protein [Methanosarcina sp.]MDW5555797.1 hypothetical protein [Methanosarcina sp.]MDW5561329.1 hypothetical protein [Methanosarcina sp.]